MKKYYITTALSLLLIFMVNSFSLQAQNQPKNPQYDLVSNEKVKRYYYVKTKDNTTFTGRVIHRNRQESEIVFELYDHYQVTVLQSNIKSMRRVKANEVQNGEYLFPDVSGGRYLIMPNAIGMKKGEFQYKTSNLLYHSLHYGVTENVSFHAGGELYTAITLQQPAYHAGINVHLPITQTLHFGTHLSFANIYGDYKNIANGYSYLTGGNRNMNFSLGYGYGYPTTAGDLSKAISYIPISMKVRMTKNFALITENWLFLNSENGFMDSSFSYGVRMLWDGYALDMAFINNEAFSGQFLLGLPMINFVYSIKK